MSECIVYNGGMFNNELLTATSDDVVYDFTFIGHESENLAHGKIPYYSNVEWTLGINNTIEIPAAYYESIEVKQKIPELGPQYIYPTIRGITAGVKGAYMTGNVVVAAIQGISPDVIRKGVQIGPYVGVFEGYVD